MYTILFKEPNIETLKNPGNVQVLSLRFISILNLMRRLMLMATHSGRLDEPPCKANFLVTLKAEHFNQVSFLLPPGV